MSSYESESHESYGMVQFNRVSSNPPQKFFGSSVRAGYYIELSIHKGEKVTSHDHFRNIFAKGEIINVRLSPNQFSELLTTMNIGSGVPCTLQRIQGEVMPELPKEDNIRQIHKDDFRREIKKATNEVKEAIKEVAEVAEVAKASFGVGKRKELLKKLKFARCVLDLFVIIAKMNILDCVLIALRFYWKKFQR